MRAEHIAIWVAGLRNACVPRLTLWATADIHQPIVIFAGSVSKPQLPLVRHSEVKATLMFVGSQQEHEVFCGQFGKVNYHPTPTLLDLARVIAGGRMFDGNQSAPRAIAESWNMKSYIEEHDRCPNTHLRRKDA